MRYANEERGDQIEAQSENEMPITKVLRLSIPAPSDVGYPSQWEASIGLPSIEMMALVPILTTSLI